MKSEAISLLKIEIAHGYSASYNCMDEMPEAPNSRVIAGLYRKAIQLREELAMVTDQLSKTEFRTDDCQVKAALKSMDDAIAKLKESRAICPNSQPLPKKQPISTPPLTLSERAVIFQSWDRKRKSSEQQSPPTQQQKASNSQL